jgi:CheY-like chemotaxis protein
MIPSSYRILVAEDDEVNAQVARTILERLGCIVDIASDGAEAVEKFRRRNYDLVLMDWQMPLMDGPEATARIRSTLRGQAIPIIATTSSRDRAECLMAGMNDVVPKPYRAEKLRLILKRWTSWVDPGTNDPTRDPKV